MEHVGSLSFCFVSITNRLLMSLMLIQLSDPLSPVKLFVIIISYMNDFCALFNTTKHTFTLVTFKLIHRQLHQVFSCPFM